MRTKNSFNHFGLAHLVYDSDSKGANSYTKWARLEQKKSVILLSFLYKSSYLAENFRVCLSHVCAKLT